MPVRIQYRYRFVLPPLEQPAAPPTDGAAAQAEAPVPAPAPPAQAATGELAGTVLERGNRTALAGILVVVEHDSDAFEALSDATGRFVFYDLPPGEWKISLRGEGYLPGRASEQVTAHE